MPWTRSAVSTALGGVVVAVVVGLTGCATAVSGSGAADPEVIARQAGALGVAPDLVFTTQADGYDLAPQSVGAGAAEGMSATWFDQTTGAMFTLRTDRGAITVESCPSTPLWETPVVPVTCTEDDGVWLRSAGGMQEYIAVRDDASIRITATGDVPVEDLLAAARAVHVPTTAELELLFSDAPDQPSGPVERGDLPQNGDGAPIQPTGPGG